MNPAHEATATGRRHGALRAVLAAGLFVPCALIVADQLAYRVLEARMVSAVVGLVLGGGTMVMSGTGTFYLNTGGLDMFGLRVTSECSSAFVVTGFLALTAVLGAATKRRATSLARAAVTAVGVLLAFNLGRLVLIALATDRWGRETGYHWSHVWAGSATTVIASVVSFAVYLAALGIRRIGPAPVSPELRPG